MAFIRERERTRTIGMKKKITITTTNDDEERLHASVFTMHYTCMHCAHTRNVHELVLILFLLFFFLFWVFGWTLWESLKSLWRRNDYKLKWMENKQHTAKWWILLWIRAGRYNIVCISNLLHCFVSSLFIFFFRTTNLLRLFVRSIILALSYTVLYTMNKWIFWLDLVVNFKEENEKKNNNPRRCCCVTQVTQHQHHY